MAVLALAVAGAALAPVGYAAIGWTVGTVVGQLLFPGSLPDQVGPRVGDLRAQQSQYGAAIPVLYGTTRVAGNVIWSTPLIETVTTTSSGGKGAPSQTQTTYSYRVSWAIMLGEGPLFGVRRIWADGKLIFDAGASTDIQSVMASNALTPNITFYPGSETQTADPTMQAYLGAANVPAYRGRAYIVFADMQLEAYGNRRPNITCEVVASGTAPAVITYANMPGIPSFTGYVSIATDGETLIAQDIGAPARYAKSIDGVNWGPLTSFPAGTAGNGFGITYVGGLWFSMETFAIVWSRDGNNWTRVTTGVPQSTTAIAWNGSTFVAVGANATWATSSNGTFWTTQPVPAVRTWYDVVWSGSLFVAVADDGTTAYSPNGFSWTVGTCGVSNIYALATNGSSVIGVNTNTFGSAIRSTNGGVTWSTFTLPLNSGGYYGVIWTGDYYVAMSAGALTNFAARSYDGITWTGFNQPSSVGSSGSMCVKGGVIFTVNYPTFVPNAKCTTIRMDVITPGAVVLSSIVSNICLRAGLAAGDIDVTALTDQVDGYAVSQQMTARAAIEPLQRAFYFDAIESAGKIVFRKRGGASVMTIDANDLAATADNDALGDDLTMTRQQEVELPAVVSVVYIDRGSDYQQNTQQAERGTVLSTQETPVELPIAMSASSARNIAETLLYDAWTQRLRYTFNTSREYAALEPADVVTLPRGSTTHTMRITKKTESRSGVIQWEAVAEESAVYTQSATGGAGVVPQTEIRTAPSTTFVPIDAPMLRDQDDNAGFYSASAGSTTGWHGAVVYRSTDGGASYDESGAVTTAASFGVVVGTLWNQNYHPNVFDEGTLINVELRSGAFSSTTEEAVLNGANTLMVGAEVLQFKSAVLYAPNTYQLSGILRGRRGTEWAMSGHAASGETVVVLNETTLRRFNAELNTERLYKPVSIGRSIQATASQPFTYTGVNQMAFAGAHLGAGRITNGDITINWMRRSRVGVSLPWNYDPALGETLEQYDVEIWNPTFVILRRTYSLLTTPTATYTFAQQSADSGGVLATYGVRVYQRNAVMGRGYVLQGVI